MSKIAKLIMTQCQVLSIVTRVVSKKLRANKNVCEIIARTILEFAASVNPLEKIRIDNNFR
jgi:hypothetical protein